MGVCGRGYTALYVNWFVASLQESTWVPLIILSLIGATVLTLGRWPDWRMRNGDVTDVDGDDHLEISLNTTIYIVDNDGYS